MTFGFVWHFVPEKGINKLEKVFNAVPIYIKALLLGFVFWIVYATASSGPQPFIYFQF
jgi:alginate O-acetyltransferase complex protein AlgI